MPFEAWTEIAPLPAIRFRHRAAAIGTFVYILGGLDAASAEQSQLWRYDVALDTYTTMAPLPATISQHEMVAVGGRLYVFGGFQNGSKLADCWRFDPASNTWAAIAPMGFPLRAGEIAAHALGTNVYLTGGRPYTGGPPALTEKYDTLTDTWTTLPAHIGDRFDPDGVAYDGKLYGQSYQSPGSNSETLVYDLATQSWSTDLGYIPPGISTQGVIAGQFWHRYGGASDIFAFHHKVDLSASPVVRSDKASYPMRNNDIAAAAVSPFLYGFGGYEMATGALVGPTARSFKFETSPFAPPSECPPATSTYAVPRFRFPSYWDQLPEDLDPEAIALLTERDRAVEDWTENVRRILGGG